jgi:Flp pilus assembly protein TadG
MIGRFLRLARRVGREEDGQVLVLFVSMFVVLVAVAGVGVDLGHAYLAKRHLQATADAAATAAADALPSVPSADAAAASYGPAGKNPISGATQTVTPACLASLTYCFGSQPDTTPTNGEANGVVVTEHETVSNSFLNLVGIDNFSVSATATACGLCSTKPLDIALVVDRTLSMSGDISQLRSGIQAFLEGLDPNLDDVSLLVLPPIPGGGSVCSAAPGKTGYPLQSGDSYPNDPKATYLAVHMSNDYLTSGGALNPNSSLVQKVNCLQAGGSTSFLDALTAGYNELKNDGSGRPGVQPVIVFESDGAANVEPDSYYSNANGTTWSLGHGQSTTVYPPASGYESDVLYPCNSAINYAKNVIQPAGILVYTVYYGANASQPVDKDCFQSPHAAFTYNKASYPAVGYTTADEGLTGQSTLAQMATQPTDGTTDAFVAEQTTDLVAQFATVAGKLDGARLVPDSEAP